MGYEHQIKLLRDGFGQIVHIPEELALPGTDAVMRKDGGRIIIEAVPTLPKQSLVEWLRTQEAIDEGIGEIEDWPPEDDVRL